MVVYGGRWRHSPEAGSVGSRVIQCRAGRLDGWTARASPQRRRSSAAVIESPLLAISHSIVTRSFLYLLNSFQMLSHEFREIILLHGI
jgi:hypothetical protein